MIEIKLPEMTREFQIGEEKFKVDFSAESLEKINKASVELVQTLDSAQASDLTMDRLFELTDGLINVLFVSGPCNKLRDMHKGNLFALIGTLSKVHKAIEQIKQDMILGK